MTIRESRTRLRAAEKAYNEAKPGRDLTEARQELTHARAEYQAACVMMIVRLEDALEPFHAESGAWHESTPEDHGILTIRDAEDIGDWIRCHMTIGDLRRLSSIYKEISDDA